MLLSESTDEKKDIHAYPPYPTRPRRPKTKTDPDYGETSIHPSNVVHASKYNTPPGRGLVRSIDKTKARKQQDRSNEHEASQTKHVHEASPDDSQ